MLLPIYMQIFRGVSQSGQVRSREESGTVFGGLTGLEEGSLEIQETYGNSAEITHSKQDSDGDQGE